MISETNMLITSILWQVVTVKPKPSMTGQM